jgi:CRP/FNR family transcriptional regulator, cyclic AMP receptor protein
MLEEIESLRGVPLFSGMSERDLRKVMEIAKVVVHSSGQLVVGEDNTAVGFHLILEGTADASVGGEVVGTIAAGDYFGEISLIDGKPRSATVTATSELKTLVVPSWSFNRMLDQHPEMMRTLLIELCARLRKVEAARS